MSEIKWKITARKPQRQIPDVWGAPLPVRIVFDAAESIAEGALNGADVALQYSLREKEPFIRCKAEHQRGRARTEVRLDVEYKDNLLSISGEEFWHYEDGTVEINRKGIALECAIGTARTIISGILTILLAAVRQGILISDPDFDIIFNLTTHQ
jgi:hypothetical protein